MARIKSSVFIEDEKDRMETLTLRVSKDLIERAEALNNELTSLGTKLKFDHNAVLRNAFKEAVIKGEKELERLRSVKAIPPSKAKKDAHSKIHDDLSKKVEEIPVS